MAFPDYEAFDYSFARAELQVNRSILTAISNVQFAQPTEEGVVEGTKPWPLARTEGKMGLGDGTITFTSERDRMRLITALGNGYRQKTFTLNWTLTAAGAPPLKFTCYSCRILDNGVSHGSGTEALAGDVKFSFLDHSINGMRPHI